jgi:integrase
VASIHPRPRSDGSTSYQVRWLEHGRQQATTAPTERAAKRVKAIIEATGTYVDAMGRTDVPTVTEQAASYLAHGSRGNDSTLEGYRRIIARHIEPAFGDVAITALTPAMLTAWGNKLPGSDKTRANITAVLSGILKSAVPDWLPANPWDKVRLRKTDGPRDQRVLSTEDFRLILEEVPEHYRPLVATLGMTGMRWGEAAALTVGDLSIDRADPRQDDGLPKFSVTKAIKHRAHQDDEPGRPKTARSVRLVTGPPQLADVLRPLLDRPATAPLFPTVTGKRIRNSTFHTLIWQPALDRAQAKGLSFRPRIHDLRAACTTWLIEGGVPIDIVADMLGHESVTTTFGIYRRVNPESGRKAAAAMGAVLERVVTPAIEG